MDDGFARGIQNGNMGSNLFCSHVKLEVIQYWARIVHGFKTTWELSVLLVMGSDIEAA